MPQEPARFGEPEHETVPQPADPLGAGSHPLAALAALSSLLCGRAATDDLVRDDATVPGPERLAEAADSLGLEVEVRQVAPARLAAADFPCVILLRDGSARIAVARPHRDVVRLYEPVPGEPPRQIDAPLADLVARASGTIFVARPSSRPAGATIADPVPGGDPVVLRSRKGLLATLVVAGLASNLISLGLPLFTMTVFDRVVPHGATETLWALAFGIMLLLALDLAIRQSRLTLGDAIALAEAQATIARLYAKLVRMPLSRAPRTAGPVVQPFADLSMVTQLRLQFMVAMAVDLPFFVAVVALLGWLGGPIAFVPLVAAGLLFAVCATCHVRAFRAAADEARFAERQWQMLIDAVGALETIKATHSAARFLGEWERRSDEAAYAAHRPRVIHGFAAHAGAFLAQAVVVATVVIGVDQIGRAAMTIGALSAAILLVGRSVAPVATLVALFFRIRQLRRTTAGLSAILAAPAEGAGDRSAALTPEGEVVLRGVSFRHAGRPEPVLRDLDLTIRPGERIGIVGRAGSGKTTLLALLARLHEPDEGTVSLDGHDARQFDPEAVRRRFALMTQDSVLIEGSLRDNLTLGLGEVDPAHFEVVARLAGVHDVAGRHPSGYGLDVGPGGGRLSRGERQGVALARALMGRPRLLLLDEPTAAMDNEREAKVIEGLRALPASTGLVVATHRLPILALVERIVWLDQGRVLADGPKDEVFRKLGVASAQESNTLRATG